MNLTTDNSIAEIVAAITHLPYPDRPTKPSISTLGRDKTPADFRAHADALEAYEREEEIYRGKRAEYNTAKAELEGLFVEKLFSESSLPRPVFDIVYSKAYEDGHSGGYYEVAGEVENLEDFVSKVIAAYK